jgi:hypothetical protein
MTPRDAGSDDIGRPTIATSEFSLSLATDQGTIVFEKGTGTWGGGGLPDPSEVPDYDGEFTATLTVAGGSGAFEGASGTVCLRGHLDEYGHWVTSSWPYSPMHIDEITGTISVLIP